MPGPRYTPWTARDISWLRRNAPLRAARDIAAHLGRTRPAVTTRAKQLGIQLYDRTQYKPWERAFVLKNVKRKTIPEIAAHLQRPERSVRSFMINNRLIRVKRRPPGYVRHMWTDKERNALRRVYMRGTPVRDIAALFGTSPNGVMRVVTKLGLHRSRSDRVRKQGANLKPVSL